MEVTVRGWGRDMGEKQLGKHFLLTMQYRENGDSTVRRDTPALYRSAGGTISVGWFKELRLTGDYWMKVELNRYDVMKLFKCMFGSELQKSLVEEWGLTFSPELVKSILKTVKLSDLTLGDLVEMNAPKSDEAAEPIEASESKADARQRFVRKFIEGMSKPNTD
jgi:hypothetical protein